MTNSAVGPARSSAAGGSPRIVSLVPSSTETLLALGADVVACTRFCEQPQLDHVGGTKNPDIAAIIELSPDVVVLDREENRREDAEALGDAGLDLVVSDVRSVADAEAVVARLAALVGAEVPEPVAPTTATGGDRRVRAFVPIWRRPWMSISSATYAGSLLASLGVDLITGDDPAAYPVVELTDMAAREPDAVLVPSEPYDFSDEHLEELRSTIPSAWVLRVDGQDLFWWGSRTPAAMHRLRVALAPVVRSIQT